MSKPSYTETTIHGPEVDFGVWWKAAGVLGSHRLTWEAYTDPKTGWSERGNVVAIQATTGNRITLGRDIPLFVVEDILSKPYNSVGIAGYDKDETGWCVAMQENTIAWVEKRLARWNGCIVVSYSGKERYGAEEKAARAYAEAWGFYAAKGGWIYTSRHKAFTQGWRSFAGDLRASRVILPIRQEVQNAQGVDVAGSPRLGRKFSETWVVSTTRSTFGA
jgi:hypothetical protein